MFVWILPEKSLCVQLLPTAANVCRSAGRLITPRKELSSLAAIPVSHGRVLLGPWWISYHWFHTLSISDLCPGERSDHIHQDYSKYSNIFGWIWYDLMIWPCACQPVTSQVLDWSPARWWNWNFTSVRAAPWHGQNQIAAQTSQYVHDIVAMFVYHFRLRVDRDIPWHSPTHNATGYREISESWDPPPGHGMQFQNLIVTGVKGQAKNLGARISKGSQKLVERWPELGTMTSLSSIIYPTSPTSPTSPCALWSGPERSDCDRYQIHHFCELHTISHFQFGSDEPRSRLAGGFTWLTETSWTVPPRWNGELGRSREVSGGLGFVRSGNDSRMLSGSGGQLLHDFADSNASGDARCVTPSHVVTHSARWNRWNGHIGLLSTLQRTVTVVFFTDYRCTPVIRCDSVIDAHVYRWPYCSAFCTHAQIWQICVYNWCSWVFQGMYKRMQKPSRAFSFICQALVDSVHSMSICLFLLHPYIPMYAST